MGAVLERSSSVLLCLKLLVAGQPITLRMYALIAFRKLFVIYSGAKEAHVISQLSSATQIGGAFTKQNVIGF